MPDLSWFYFICLLSATVLWKDYNGTLEEDLNKFEMSIGIRTILPEDSTENDLPYYIAPIEDEPIDSTWILPEYPTKRDTTK